MAYENIGKLVALLEKELNGNSDTLRVTFPVAKLLRSKVELSELINMWTAWTVQNVVQSVLARRALYNN